VRGSKFFLTNNSKTSSVGGSNLPVLDIFPVLCTRKNYNDIISVAQQKWSVLTL